jgi:hypothetical protein
MLDCLLCKCEVLSSNPSSTKKKKQKTPLLYSECDGICLKSLLLKKLRQENCLNQRVPGQPGVHSETLLLKKKKKKPGVVIHV